MNIFYWRLGMRMRYNNFFKWSYPHPTSFLFHNQSFFSMNFVLFNQQKHFSPKLASQATVMFFARNCDIFKFQRLVKI